MLRVDECSNFFNFMMRFFEGYTETEIADDLELNVATVKTRAFRARSHVRARLASALAA